MGLLAPPIAMLYVARPLRAAAYLGASVLSFGLTVLGSMKGVADPTILSAAGSIVLSLVGAADAFRLARSFRRSALPWYSRGPAIAAILCGGWLLVMGDNRDNSADSRYIGFVPEANFVGRAFLVWAARDPGRSGTRVQ